jgi:tRNA A37 threonylcarbamoyladenosine synthetase subunit TsaC/SUA5/YrdC
VPSTLVNCNLPTPVVERVGAVPAERIAEVLEGTQP